MALKFALLDFKKFHQSLTCDFLDYHNKQNNHNTNVFANHFRSLLQTHTQDAKDPQQHWSVSSDNTDLYTDMCFSSVGRRIDGIFVGTLSYSCFGESDLFISRFICVNVCRCEAAWGILFFLELRHIRL